MLAVMSMMTYADHNGISRQAAGLAAWTGKKPALFSRGPARGRVLPRRLQRGEKLEMPHSRPLPSVSLRCLELRIQNERATWRIVYRVDSDAIVIVEVFSKKTQATPRQVIEVCQRHLRLYDRAVREEVR